MITYLRESLLLTGRSLRAIPRVPQRLLDVTIQPVIFVLLFRYVFGSAIHPAGVSNYSNYLMPGLVAQGLAFGMIGAGVATSSDMSEGVLDRFRSMPVMRISVVTGEVLGQYCEAVLGLCVYVAVGLLCGWRPTFGAGGALAWTALMLFGTLAFTWAGAYFGMLVRSPEAMQGVGFALVFPLAFLAGAFVPISGMALVPRIIGDWDPISALVSASRLLANGYGSSGSWLLTHGVLAMVIWSLLLLAIFIPLSLRRFNSSVAA